MMDILHHLGQGFAVALTPLNLVWLVLGSALGTVLGMLPGWRSRRNVRGHAEPARSDLAPLDDQLTSPPHGV